MEQAKAPEPALVPAETDIAYLMDITQFPRGEVEQALRAHGSREGACAALLDKPEAERDALQRQARSAEERSGLKTYIEFIIGMN